MGLYKCLANNKLIIIKTHRNPYTQYSNSNNNYKGYYFPPKRHRLIPLCWLSLVTNVQAVYLENINIPTHANMVPVSCFLNYLNRIRQRWIRGSPPSDES